MGGKATCLLAKKTKVYVLGSMGGKASRLDNVTRHFCHCKQEDHWHATVCWRLGFMYATSLTIVLVVVESLSGPCGTMRPSRRRSFIRHKHTFRILDQVHLRLSGGKSGDAGNLGRVTVWTLVRLINERIACLSQTRHVSDMLRKLKALCKEIVYREGMRLHSGSTAYYGCNPKL
ncbi:hypothetical protein DFJ77DRAFT_462868 [Powellomyces hirtus]|nr:hypothetical protein DFJ77DRAFT_462868 [Powellomyces hirtus]